MTNDLNNFLERETQNITQYAYFVDHQSEEDLAEVVREHNTRLINFVLSEVEKEVKSKSFEIKTPETISELQKVTSLDSVSTIINNLRDGLIKID